MIKQLLVDQNGHSINPETRSIILRWMMGLCVVCRHDVHAQAYLLELIAHHANQTRRDWQ